MDQSLNFKPFLPFYKARKCLGTARFCLKVFHIILKVLIYPEFFGKVSPHSVDFGVVIGLGLIYLLLFVMNSCDLLYLKVKVLVGLGSGIG